MTTLVAIHAQAKETVKVYVENGAVIPDRTLRRAEGSASGMFARLDVRINWRIGRPSGDAIKVEFSDVTLSSDHPGALAFARPYERVHITVFYDRIRKIYAPDVAPALLAHVPVHEIAHTLQDVDRHSQTGIMKAHWTESEIAQMPLKPLSFTVYDVSLIQSGITVRQNAATRIGGAQ